MKHFYGKSNLNFYYEIHGSTTLRVQQVEPDMQKNANFKKSLSLLLHDVYEALYQNWEIQGTWDRGLGHRAGQLADIAHIVKL